MEVNILSFRVRTHFDKSASDLMKLAKTEYKSVRKKERMKREGAESSFVV